MIEYSLLVNQLKALIKKQDAPLMIHASLRSIGPIAGGADALLDALFECIGENGTLLMPLGADPAVPFDYLKSPADKEMGLLAEVFRQRNGTRVNDHAAARFGVRGPLSVELLEPTPLHDYHGPGSVLSRFTENAGQVLRLGANIDTVTLTHWAEYLANISSKRRVRRCYLRADIGEQWIESLDDTDGIVDWSGGDYFSKIWLDFLTNGQVQCSQIGNCTAELFAAKTFVHFAVTWLETTIH